jgi:aspartate aminotransferase
MTLTISQRVQAIEESSTVKLFGQVEALKASGKQIITFNLGEPDFDPPAPIMNATRKALDENQTKYSANPGLKTLREAILVKLKNDNGIDAKLENILVANGSKQVLYNLFQTILNPGDEVIVLRPYWVTFPEGIKLAGGIPVFVDTVEHQPDLALIEAAITPKTKAVLINSPNNPTGALYPAETLRAIGHLCLEKGVYLISDEAYELLAFDGAKHVSVASLDPAFAENTITVQTFSKSYCMTGFRIGFMVAPAGLIKAIGNLHSHLTGNVCTFAQYGAIAALTMDQHYLTDMLDIFQRRLEVAWPLCNELFECVKPGGAFYCFPNVEKYLGDRFADDNALAAHLLNEALVATVPGSAFGAPGHLRISFSCSEDDIREGYARIRQVLLG